MSCVLLAVCRLLGMLLSRVIADSTSAVTHDRCPLELVSQLFTFYLGSRSALQKYCTAYVISEWAAALPVHCSLHTDTLSGVKMISKFLVKF